MIFRRRRDIADVAVEATFVVEQNKYWQIYNNSLNNHHIQQTRKHAVKMRMFNETTNIGYMRRRTDTKLNTMTSKLKRNHYQENH